MATDRKPIRRAQLLIATSATRTCFHGTNVVEAELSSLPILAKFGDGTEWVAERKMLEKIGEMGEN